MSKVAASPVLHVVEGSALFPATGVTKQTNPLPLHLRPDSVAEAYRREIAELFDSVLRARGIASSKVAAIWQCDESLVRNIRLGIKPLTEEKLAMLPPEVAIAFYEKRVEQLKEKARTSDQITGTVMQEAAKVVVLAGEIITASQQGNHEAAVKSSAALRASTIRLEILAERDSE